MHYLRHTQLYTVAKLENDSISELLNNVPSNHNDISFVPSQFDFIQNTNASFCNQDYTLGEAMVGSIIIVRIYCGVMAGLCYAGVICSDSSTGYITILPHRGFEM